MDSFDRLLDTCARTLSRYENVAAEGAVLAAVSGGMDSTLLLLALKRLDEAEAALAQFKTKMKGSSYLKGANLDVYKALRAKYKPLGGRERALQQRLGLQNVTKIAESTAEAVQRCSDFDMLDAVLPLFNGERALQHLLLLLIITNIVESYAEAA